MSFEGAGLNLRRPVLISALGRAWLAFCPDDERRAILRDVGGVTRRQEAALDAVLERVRRDGVAFTQPPRPTRLQGMAVAIRRGPRMLGSLSMRFTRSAMSDAEAAHRFGRRLQSLARAIARDVAGWLIRWWSWRQRTRLGRRPAGRSDTTRLTKEGTCRSARWC